jgi:hypothetical protein
MTQSEFDRRIQQESRNPIVDDDIKAEKKSFGHRLQCILKAEEHDVKHFGFHTTDRKITIHHKDQNSSACANNPPEGLQALCDFCQQERS